ncbi:hypothetical protein C2W62_46655, partial [Candidatus Entotheonella serta]
MLAIDSQRTIIRNDLEVISPIYPSPTLQKEVAMAEILGVGMTHYPGLIGVDERGSSSLARVLKHNPHIPEAKKDPQTWPEARRLEFGHDEG